MIMLLIACAVGFEKILSSLNYGNVLILALQGIGIVLVGSFAFGLVIGIGFIIIMIMEINPEIYLEEKGKNNNR